MKFIILLIIACLVPANTHAQSNLEQFMQKHPEFEESANFDPGLRGPKWLKPGTNFSTLFQKRGGPILLLTWLAIDESAFQLKEPWVKSVDDFVGAGASYLTQENVEILLSVLIPHPKQITSRELGLLKEFSKLEPPQLNAISSEPVDLNGFAAQLYQDASDACHILLSLTKGGLLSVGTAQCKNKKELINFARKLNITRLETKLNS